MSDFDVDIRWVQINNAIVPVVHRRCDDILIEVPLVPLLVIRHAVGLLKDVDVDTVSCTDDEALALTKCCQDVGIKISFDVTTELIDLCCLPDLSEEKVVFSMLSTGNTHSCSRSWSRDENVIKQDTTHRKEFLLDYMSSKTVTDYSKEVDERILKETDQVYINNINEDQQQKKTTEKKIVKYEVKKTADYLTMMNHQNGGILITSKISPRTSTCSTEVVIKTRSIFGEQVHCLLKDGELYVLIDELHRLFFYHIDLSIFVHIYERLVKSTIDITSHEINLITPFIGRIRCSETVRFGEVKCLLVNLKAILKKMKNTKRDLNIVEDKKVQYISVESNQQVLSSGNNMNVLLLSYCTQSCTKDIVLNVLPCTKSWIPFAQKSEYGLSHNATQTCHIEDGQSSIHEDDGIRTTCGVTESKNTEYNYDLTNDRCVTDSKQDTDYHNVLSHLTLVDGVNTNKYLLHTDHNVVIQELKIKEKKKRLMDVVDKVRKRKRLI